jgi:chromosome segregation ATPase
MRFPITLTLLTPVIFLFLTSCSRKAELAQELEKNKTETESLRAESVRLGAQVSDAFKKRTAVENLLTAAKKDNQKFAATREKLLINQSYLESAIDDVKKQTKQLEQEHSEYKSKHLK